MIRFSSRITPYGKLAISSNKSVNFYQCSSTFTGSVSEEGRVVPVREPCLALRGALSDPGGALHGAPGDPRGALHGAARVLRARVFHWLVVTTPLPTHTIFC